MVGWGIGAAKASEMKEELSVFKVE